MPRKSTQVMCRVQWRLCYDNLVPSTWNYRGLSVPWGPLDAMVTRLMSDAMVTRLALGHLIQAAPPEAPETSEAPQPPVVPKIGGAVQQPSASCLVS